MTTSFVYQILSKYIDASLACVVSPGHLHYSRGVEAFLQNKAKTPSGSLSVGRQDVHGLFQGPDQAFSQL
jgi:predicted class III extradiol MEMO1 family dioxygenase